MGNYCSTNCLSLDFNNFRENDKLIPKEIYYIEKNEIESELSKALKISQLKINCLRKKYSTFSYEYLNDFLKKEQLLNTTNDGIQLRNRFNETYNMVESQKLFGIIEGELYEVNSKNVMNIANFFIDPEFRIYLINSEKKTTFAISQNSNIYGILL
jgi:hypothetical protein